MAVHAKRLIVLAAGLLGYAAFAAAQSYPTKPIRVVVASAPGGSTDGIARTVGDKLTEQWGQQVVHDNRPGAGGIIAAEIVARAAPDGYTLLFSTTAGVAASGSLYRKLPYDPVRDFTPISLVATQPYMLVVNRAVASSVQDFVARAKAKPGQLSFGSTGVGTSSHLTGELLKTMAGVELLHVPYKSMSAALLDAMSGRISAVFASTIAGRSHVKSGKLRALAVTSAKRSSAMPELPTLSEAGIAGYELENWYGMLAPARTPPAVAQALNSAIVKGLAQREVRGRMAREGTVPVGSSAEAFAAFIKTEIQKWAKLIKSAGIAVEGRSVRRRTERALHMPAPAHRYSARLVLAC